MQLAIPNFTWVKLVFLMSSLCTWFQFSNRVLGLHMWNGIKTKEFKGQNMARGDLLWVGGLRWWCTRFCYFTHSRRVQSLSTGHTPASPLPFLHLERKNSALGGGCKHYSALTTWLWHYQIITFTALELLSYRIKSYVPSLVVQCKIFTLSLNCFLY